jgi:GntR family transcriptional regulator, transcriptional repressor for pyruvate dehydrogenase complex
MTSYPSPPIDRGRLSDSVAAAIAERIVAGELRPLERLPTEAELGETLGVSRSVVRDAMRTLSARGLIDVHHGIGMIVAEPNGVPFGDALMLLLARSDVTMGDVIEARAALETELGALAADRGTASDWDVMEDALSRFAGAVDEQDWELAHTAHLNFHSALLDAVHLPALSVILRPLEQLILASSTPAVADDPAAWEVAYHHPILSALRARDRDATRRAVEAHFAAMERPQYHAAISQPFGLAASTRTLIDQSFKTAVNGAVRQSQARLRP